MKTVGIIPARWASTRFPGKPLALIAGKTLLQRVWERCLLAKKLDRVIVATDDRRIAEAALGMGAEVAMTSPDHPSGTDRIAEVAATLTEAEAIVNIQGDEPLLNPDLIDQLVDVLAEKNPPDMVTAASIFRGLDHSNIVKVVLNRAGDALYFSRAAIPFARDNPESSPVYRHHGIYGYRKNFLLQFVSWPQGMLEKTEQLEQLRALENGGRIRVLLTDHEGWGVDSPADVAMIEARLDAIGDL